MGWISFLKGLCSLRWSKHSLPFYNGNIHYLIHKGLLLDPILSQFTHPPPLPCFSHPSGRAKEADPLLDSVTCYFLRWGVGNSLDNSQSEIPPLVDCLSVPSQQLLGLPRFATWGRVLSWWQESNIKKVKLSLCLNKHHAMKAYWGSKGIAPRILWPRQLMEVSGQLHLPAALPAGNPRYPLYSGVGPRAGLEWLNFFTHLHKQQTFR